MLSYSYTCFLVRKDELMFEPVCNEGSAACNPKSQKYRQTLFIQNSVIINVYTA